MRVMFDVAMKEAHHAPRQAYTDAGDTADEDRGFLRALVQAVLQELLDVEMTAGLGAEQRERTPESPQGIGLMSGSRCQRYAHHASENSPWRQGATPAETDRR
jgi:transposase-like protein